MTSLVTAILSGDISAIKAAVEDRLMEKAADKIQERKVEIAQTAFNVEEESSNDSDEDEQLDELSKETVRNYYAAANRDRDRHQKASEVSTNVYGSQDSRTKGHDAEVAKRTKGLNRAVKKFAKGRYAEEVENLDELSKQTLSNYIKGAARDAKGYAAAGGYTRGLGNVEKFGTGKKSLDKAAKRVTGINKAVDKLSK